MTANIFEAQLSQNFEFASESATDPSIVSPFSELLMIFGFLAIYEVHKFLNIQTIKVLTPLTSLSKKESFEINYYWNF